MQEEYNKTYAKVFRNGKLVKILTSDIVKGDTILIQAGDKVPVDGLLFKGNVKVSQAALNGESRDESKTAADSMEEAEIHGLLFCTQGIYGICCNQWGSLYGGNGDR